MEPRVRRLALREHLTDARAALEQGDRVRALAAVEAALAVDPYYLAAQALKDRIEREPRWDPSQFSASREGVQASSANDDAAHAEASAGQHHGVGTPLAVGQPSVATAEGWARFEQRARGRRIERRMAAAHAALQKRRFAEANTILVEIRELDPGHPAVTALQVELESQQHRGRPRSNRLGPALAAAAVFGGVLLGVRYVDQPRAAIPISAPAAPVSDRITPVADASGPATAVQTNPAVPLAPASSESGAVLPTVDVPAAESDAPAVTAAKAFEPPGLNAGTPLQWPASGTLLAPPRPLPARDPEPFNPVSTGGRIEAPPRLVWPPATPSLPPAAAPVALPGAPSPEREAPVVAPPDPKPDPAPAAAAVVVPRDEDLVRQTLQHYRVAYDGLDARSAQSVWPGVDEGALQRAFDGLQWQRLRFDDCQVQVRGLVSSATCQGSTLYVTKVGSREQRQEPRVWTFDLRKVGENWQIDSARTAR